MVERHDATRDGTHGGRRAGDDDWAAAAATGQGGCVRGIDDAAQRERREVHDLRGLNDGDRLRCLAGLVVHGTRLCRAQHARADVLERHHTAGRIARAHTARRPVDGDDHRACAAATAGSRRVGRVHGSAHRRGAERHDLRGTRHLHCLLDTRRGEVVAGLGLIGVEGAGTDVEEGHDAGAD